MTSTKMIQLLVKVKELGIKGIFKKTGYLVLKWFGYQLLSVNQTIAFLSPYQIMLKAENRVFLPAIVNCASCANKDTPIFTEREGITDPAYVWLYEQEGQKAMQLPHGTVLIENKAGCTDFDHSSFYKKILNRHSRQRKTVRTLIAPWTQYLDSVSFGGYYDFVLLVAAKLSRIKDALPANEFSEAVVSYPLFDTAYEQEYLQLLGIKLGKIFDSRFNDITAERTVLGNSGHWFYPNAADILLLKKYVEDKLQVQRTGKNRIYMSRSGRRQIKNEQEVMLLLKKFDFIFIEDKERSVAEQVELYKNASFIIGPHGASFTNIIWCDPGTHLIELFSPNYAPDYYLYMANILGLEYSAYYYGRATPKMPVPKAFIEDIFVSISDLETCLTQVFKEQAAEVKMDS